MGTQAAPASNGRAGTLAPCIVSIPQSLGGRGSHESRNRVQRPGEGARAPRLPDPVSPPLAHRRHCLTAARDVTLRSRHPGHAALPTPGPHQPTSTLTPPQPHRPVELRVSGAPAITPALATACAPTGTLDLVPRLGPLLGLPACQPLPGEAPGLQGADQRRGCPGSMGAGGGALSRPGRTPPGSCRPEEPQHTLEQEPDKPVWPPRSPPGTPPPQGSGTLHCTGSLHTG